MFCSHQHHHDSSVLLLEPVSTKRPSKKTTNKRTLINNYNDPRASYLGGLPCTFSGDVQKYHQTEQHLNPQCEICNEDMFLILQMYAPLDFNEYEEDTTTIPHHSTTTTIASDSVNSSPYNLDRTMYVFGCNNASCVYEAFQRQRSQNCQEDQLVQSQEQCKIRGHPKQQNINSRESKACIDKGQHDDANIDSENMLRHRFLLGGQGVVRCFRSQQYTNQKHKKKDDVMEQTNKITQSILHAHETNFGWDDDTNDDNKNNDIQNGDSDWDFDDDADVHQETYSDMDDLEAMVAAMEKSNLQQRDTKGKNNHSTATRNRSSRSQRLPKNAVTPDTAESAVQIIENVFPRYDLDAYDEPSMEQVDSDDEDVDRNIHDDTIQSLLTKYLEQEEDSDIVAAIKGGSGQTGTITDGLRMISKEKGNQVMEKYEKVSPEDKALLTFSARIKRAPKQSVRYAYGGIPLWSIPTPVCGKGRSKKKDSSHDVTSFPKVPPCACGAHREFEFQLMPSILHVMNVDDYTKQSADTTTKSRSEIDRILGKSTGGMNWGTIAVYSCSVSCEEYREEYVIVQESVDGTPKKMPLKLNGKTLGSGDDIDDHDHGDS